MSDDIKKFAELAGGQYPRGRYPNAIMFYPKELDRFVELIEKAQAARIAELEAALRFANEYVGRLALTLAKKHYPDQQSFELLPDLLGRIDQIDNMTCGLHRAKLAGGEEKLTPKEALAEFCKEQKRLNLDD